MPYCCKGACIHTHDTFRSPVSLPLAIVRNLAFIAPSHPLARDAPSPRRLSPSSRAKHYAPSHPPSPPRPWPSRTFSASSFHRQSLVSRSSRAASPFTPSSTSTSSSRAHVARGRAVIFTHLERRSRARDARQSSKHRRRSVRGSPGARPAGAAWRAFLIVCVFETDLNRSDTYSRFELDLFHFVLCADDSIRNILSLSVRDITRRRATSASRCPRLRASRGAMRARPHRRARTRAIERGARVRGRR